MITVTPNKRLARALERDAAEAQVAAGNLAWMRNPAMPWAAWMEALLDEYLAVADVDALPLGPHQSLLIWKEVVSDDIAVNPGGVAAIAQKAWARMHDWLLPGVEAWDPLKLSVDSAQFSAWAKRYRQRLDDEGWIDVDLWRRHLPDIIADGDLALPEKVVLAGFNLGLSPAQKAIVEAFRGAGVSVVEKEIKRDPARPVVACADDREDELERAANWAREKLDAGASRVGLVVPDLSSRLGEVDRVLRRALRPDVARLEGSGDLPWHLTLGAPLSGFPIIAQALDVLKLDPASLGIIQLSTALRSPFLAGWQEEQAPRADLDFDLRKLPGDEITFTRLRAAIARGGRDLTLLIGHLEAWLEAREAGDKPRVPSFWARQFLDELSGFGFGSGRSLSSSEYQAWEAFHGVLEQFAALDTVSGPVGRGRAVGLVHDLAHKRLFREKNPGAPIEVLTVTEALGGEFDAMWVVGMDDSRWPAPVQPDPLIPRSLQADCPDATAEGQLQRARAMIDGLCRCAEEVVMSYAALEGDLPMRCSTLVEGRLLGAKDLVAGEFPPFPEQAPLAPAQEDRLAPALSAPDVRGGTQVLRAQATCAFKALAEHRLGAVGVEEPRPGLSARDRGSLLHYALEAFWQRVESSDELAQLSEEQLEDLAKSSAAHGLRRILRRNPSVMSPQMKSLEQARLVQRLLDWLELEKRRPGFEVKSVEEKRTLDVGGLSLEVKLDRIDRLPDGGELLIDYKGGKPKASNWYPGGPIADPQLPAYILTMDDAPAGLAFAKLRPDQLGFAGISGPDPGIDGIVPLAKATRSVFRDYDSWADLVGDWKVAVEGLAQDFGDGKADVAPRASGVCDFCELKALCRLRQRGEMRSETSD